MVLDKVEDEESLYRRIGQEYYKILPDGSIRISSSAFGDREFQISVNRAKFYSDAPITMCVHVSDGIAMLQAFQVYSIQITRNDEKGRPFQEYLVEITPAPLEDNPSHAHIHTDPVEKRVFNKLSEKLAHIANDNGWTCKPVIQ